MKKILIFPIFILITLSNCLETKSDDDDSILLLLAAAALNAPRAVEEPRPFRGRSVGLNQGGTIQVYDWNQEAFLSIRNGDSEISGVNQIFESGSGRFAYLRVAGGFRILDTELNLSPHGDHFHYERKNYYRSVSTTRIDLTGSNARTALSKDGWVAFYYTSGANSSIKFVKENNIITEETIPVLAGPAGLPANMDGAAVMIRENLALIPIASNGTTVSQFQAQHYNGTAWTTTLPGPNTSINFSCNNYQTLAFTETPTSDANFSNLNTGYNKLHYVVVSCGNTIHIVKHNDSTNTTSYTSVTTPNSSVLFNVKRVIMNNNIERGGKTAKPLFVANSGGDTESSIVIINAETATITSIPTLNYRSNHLVTETRFGETASILASDSSIVTYNLENRSEISRFASQINNISSADFVSGWESAIITSGTTIQEYNIKEQYKARTVNQNADISKLYKHFFYGIGVDYTGAAH
ncbi:hypothetical protein [Leptospira sp. GIMC2001]|uniref:hypothetical protein n=1 Tax=Leptospira sp. GIMC2001 TaxID=1513297 RepID=UPI00234B23A9|nr:hypothetical protein [Leptospira sp. GIMC2001]WCL48400.1 hypothetical protein O4O04_13940 [Leptospira sp. GIMC2001]